MEPIANPALWIGGRARWATPLFGLLLLGLLPALLGSAPPAAPPWYGEDADGAALVHLYYFSSRGCAHCARAGPIVAELAETHPWLRVHAYELSSSREGRELYAAMAARLGEEARYVPAFAFCEMFVTGFPETEPPGAELRQRLLACHAARTGSRPIEATGDPGGRVSLPWVGEVDPGSVSLPLLTVLLAGLDGFNPCAFFVLLILLSLLVHARRRSRIFLVGGIFVLFSGLFYFVFMAAWLNAFLLLGEMRAITRAAGGVAVAMAAFNLKDSLWPGHGPSLSIPESAKPGLFRRMRRLAGAAGLPSVLLGTVVLAVAANSYEMLCTAGFPLVFTRALTLHDLPTGQYYLYLALYNAVYVVPLAAVVIVFGATLGSRKLGEEQGRTLKLLSGLMLLALGMVLLVEPLWLQHPLTGAALLAAAVALTALFAGLRALQRAPDKGGR